MKQLDPGGLVQTRPTPVVAPFCMFETTSRNNAALIGGELVGDAMAAHSAADAPLCKHVSDDMYLAYDACNTTHLTMFETTALDDDGDAARA
jgi:hypothetical protein